MNPSNWCDLLSSLIAAIGENSFYEKVADCGEVLTGYDSTVVVAFFTKQKPVLLYSNLSEIDETSTLSPYFDGAYLLDPLYACFKEEEPDGVFVIEDIAPEDFFKTEYFLRYYRKTRIIHEIGLSVKINSEISVSISYGLREDSNPKENHIETLKEVYPILAAACKQNWSRENQFAPLQKNIIAGGEFGSTLDNAFINFGKNYLTPRECEIVCMILKGYSSKSISELFDISLETVKVHRKRIYAKLDIASQAELFSLFLESISLVPPMGIGEEDPLSLYYHTQS